MAKSEDLKWILKRNKVPISYEYELHSFNISLEPYYFWILDFMKKTLGLTVEKIGEELGASVVSQFFGEMSARRQFLEKRGMEILGSVNTVIKSIINLLYDLRELDRRLAVYKDLKSEDEKEREAARITLKRVWMDEVDIKKGPGSINSLTTQKGFEFITLRDAFLQVNSLADIEKVDLNERVKRILKDRFKEYQKWEEESYKELTQRRKLELSYLKAQVESLRLYSLWARPYLRAAQMLQFKEAKLGDPELIQAFDQNFITIKLRAYSKKYLKEFYKAGPGGLPKKYKPPEFIPEKKKAALKAEKAGPHIYTVYEVSFTFRSRPAMVTQSGGSGVYRQFGMINIKFEGYLLRPDEFKQLKKMEEVEAMKFIEGLTKESLAAMREDLEKYLGEIEKLEEKKKEESKPKPIIDRILGIGGESSEGESKITFFSTQKLMEEQAKELALPGAMELLFTIYDVFKKAHKELSFPYPPDFYEIVHVFPRPK